MLQQELIDIIEKYCKGKEPTDAQIDEIMDKALVLNADVDEVATMMEELHNLPAQEEPKEKNTPGEVEAGVVKEEEKTVAMPQKPLENKTGEERDNQKANKKRKTKANRDSERVKLIEEEAEPKDAHMNKIMDKALEINADADEGASMMEELHNLPAQEEPKEKNTPGEVEAGVVKEEEKTVAMPQKPLENKTGEERDNQKTNRKRKTKANRDSERVELIEEEAEPTEENEIQKKIDQRLKEVEETVEEKYKELLKSREEDIRNVRKEIEKKNIRGFTRILKYVGLGFVLIFLLSLAVPFEMALMFGIGIPIYAYWKRD